MRHIPGRTTLVTWKDAVSVLVANGGEYFHIVLDVERPTEIEMEWLEDYCPKSIRSDSEVLRDVVNMTFPIQLAERSTNRNNLYRRYNRVYEKSKRWPRNRSAWGTYFRRLINYRGDGSINQLETVIGKINNWPRRSTGSLVLHLTAPDRDNLRPRGGPCWQFGEVLWHQDDVLDLFVVYRNHDYFNRTLGNLIALGQLLNFICQATGKEPGRLICHSAHAFYQASNANMNRLARL